MEVLANWRSPTDYDCDDGSAYCGVSCSEQEVWTTTLKGAAAPKDAAAINKIGIATQGPVTVEHPERITSQMDQSSRQASAIIVRTTNLNETRFIRENAGDQFAQIPSTCEPERMCRLTS